MNLPRRTDRVSPRSRRSQPVNHGILPILKAQEIPKLVDQVCPVRKLHELEILDADISRAKSADAVKILADEITEHQVSLRLPNGLSALGYSREDIPDLVQGTLPQHRVTKLSPRPASEEDLAEIFEDALVAW